MAQSIQGTALHRLKRAALCVARFALVFAMVFSFAGWGTGAFSALADEGDADTGGTGAYVVGIEIYSVDSTGAGTFITDSSASEPVTCTIQEKGGSLQLASRIIWNDGSYNDDDYRVSWEMTEGDPAVANLYPSGLVEALGTTDGVVCIQAKVPAEYSASGQDITASLYIDVTRQTDSRYVQSIKICDESDNPLESAYTISDQDLSTAIVEFHARVEVADPSTGEVSEYIVRPGYNLNAQASDMADVVWSVGDDAIGSITDGWYRPSAYTTNEVRCSSTAGLDGHEVVSTVNVMMEGEGDDESHPQDSLYVYVTYEAYPDDVVSEKTYTVDELAGLGSVVVTYTAITSSQRYGFFTRTGSGPYLSTILADVGVNDIDSISTIQTVSYDGPDSISAAALFDENRYYFPNYSLNRSQAGAVQVAPMLAVSTSRSPTGSDSPDYDNWTDGLRFCLLYGAASASDSNAQHQRKWVNTLHVILAGGPPTDPDMPDDPDDPDDPDTPSEPEQPSDSEQPAENDEPEQTSQPEQTSSSVGGGGGGNTAGVVSAGSGQGSQSNSTGEQESQSGSTQGDSGAEAEQGEQASSSGSDGGGWSIYQVMSPYNNDVGDVMRDNPFAPYVFPAGIAIVGAGFAEYAFWFLRQRRPPVAKAA